MSARRPFRIGLFLGLSSLSLGLSAEPPAAEDRAPSWRGRLGVEAARSLVASEDLAVRLRGFERLGALGTSAALELLGGALAPGGLARSPRERLVAVRALAPHARHEAARSALVRAMSGALTRDEPLETLVRLTAALSLAAAGHPDADRALAQALRQPGRVAEAARLALRAHPPRTLDALLEGRGVPTVALATLLGDLGRAEGRHLALSLTRTGSPSLRAAALVSLARLAPASASELASTWRRNEKHPTLRVAAARVLALTNHRDAPGALAELLGSSTHAMDALQIALHTPSPALAEPLGRAKVTDPASRPLLLAALGRAGGAAALGRLARELEDPEHGWQAAYALSLSTDSGANRILERALAGETTRRNAVRAGALRERALGETIDGLEHATARLTSSRDPADRAAAALARALGDPETGRALIAAADRPSVLAAARAALAPELATAAARRLAVEDDPMLKTALSIALADTTAQDLVPDRVLVGLLEARGPAAHLAAYALAARDGEAKRPRLRELLESGDVLLRAHVALGLARSADPSAVGLLDGAYRFESDPLVRRAIVGALARRSEPGRQRTLELAARLDPDDQARETARRALSGAARDRAEPTGTAWLRVLAPARSPALDWFAVLVTPSGLALPMASDPDGAVVAFGLPSGELALALAPATPGDNASPPRQQ